MKTIYLLTDYSWWRFDYKTLSDLSEEFAKRSILIGSDVRIGSGVHIGGSARIGDGARIGSSVGIEAGAYINSGVIIGARTHIGVSAHIGSGALVGRDAYIEAGAYIGVNARVGRDARIEDNEQVMSIVISGSCHLVLYWGADCIQIGCKQYSIAEWQKHFRAVGKAEGYTPEQIEEYGGYIEMIANYHKTQKR